MIKCPNCGETFNLDGSELSSIIAQIRNHEFDEEVQRRVEKELSDIQDKHAIDV